jgi:anaerobic ribonucleoside-triphosphate reductase
MEAVRRSYATLDNPGFCVACGEEADGCEPDAEHYECESCGKHQVFGAETLLMHL